MRRFHGVLGALTLGGLASIIASNHGPAIAAPRAAFRMPQTRVAPRLVRFAVRPYTIGGQTINIFIGPLFCNSGNFGGYGLASGLNSQLWYTVYGSGCNTGAVISLTTAGIATVYALSGSLLGNPTSVTESADKAHMWFLGNTGTDALASITPSGGVTPYPIANRPGVGGDILSGPDSRLYFGINYGKIGAITEAGVVTSYPLAAGGDSVTELTIGNDGNIWFSNANVNGLTSDGVGKIRPRAL